MESGGGSGSKDSLHGLQFGKKIYFEDVGRGGSASKPSPVPPGPAKKGKGVGQGGGGQQHPPRCQVEGCMEDLTNAKSYYCRHKVCGVHSKSPKVVVAGMEQRFCQQCSRFHQLHEFDQGKRSCRRRLAGHNERRRKPPPAPFPSRYGHLSPPFHGIGGRFGGFVMDFSYPRPQTNERDAWLAAWPNDLTSAIPWSGETSRVPAQVVYHNYGQASTGESIYDHELQPCNCLGASDSSCALSLLSTQPWGATATSSRAVMISGNNYNIIPMTQPTAAPGVVGYSWSSKANETGNGMHDIPPRMGLGMESGTGGDRFSGELELALQGRRGCGPPNNDLQWSL